MNGKILSDKKVIEKFILLSFSKCVLKKLIIVRTNLLSSEVKEVAEEFSPILASASKAKFINLLNILSALEKLEVHEKDADWLYKLSIR